MILKTSKSTKKSNRLEILSSERISDEINKILMSETPSNGFKNLEKLNLLNYILPELVNLKGVEEVEGQTHKDNFYHTLEVVDNISRSTEMYGLDGQHFYMILVKLQQKTLVKKLMDISWS